MGVVTSVTAAYVLLTAPQTPLTASPTTGHVDTRSSSTSITQAPANHDATNSAQRRIASRAVTSRPEVERCTPAPGTPSRLTIARSPSSAAEARLPRRRAASPARSIAAPARSAITFTRLNGLSIPNAAPVAARSSWSSAIARSTTSAEATRTTYRVAA